MRPGPSMRPVCLRAPVWMAALLGLFLPAARADAADVAVLGVAQNTVMQSRTLRIPRSGTFNMDSAANGYLAVAVGISDIQHFVDAATWTSTRPGAGPPQALAQKSSRHGDDGSPAPDQMVSSPPEPTVRLDGNLSALPGPDAGGAIVPDPEDATSDDDGGTAGGPHTVDLQVGCACRMGATAPGSGVLCGALLIALALLRRRSVRR